MNLKRQVQHEVLRSHPEKEPTEIRCQIYVEMLSDGTLSPGFKPTHDQNRYPVAWVVPYSAMETRDMRGTVDPTLFADSDAAKRAWARQHVRLVQVEFPGPLFKPNPSQWDVIVAAPFGTSTRGRLIRKPGEVEAAKVPEGETAREQASRDLTSRTNSTAKKLSGARAHFSADDGRYRLPNGQAKAPQFPKDGDTWN